MFTGIVQGTAEIINIQKSPNLWKFAMKFPENLAENLQIGASVANDGCCLTIVHFDKNLVQFDVIKETLEKTTLQQKKSGDFVNIERSMKMGDEIGGHLLSGHIMERGKIVAINNNNSLYEIQIEIPEFMQKYLLHKGFIAIDGMSLTIGNVEKNRFWLHLIPETLRLTTISQKKPGDFVNVEIDPQTQIIIENIARILSKKL